MIYKANVREIITERAAVGAGEAQQQEGGLKAVGVRLADGREFRARTVVSNATRWDTFEHMLGEDKMPEDEKLFRWVGARRLLLGLGPSCLAGRARRSSGGRHLSLSRLLGCGG